MKRQKVRPSSAASDDRLRHRYYDDDDNADQIRMAKRDFSVPRNVMEAQVQEGDTLQAIAIRYNCSVSDIKRLNKIERDLEIHARKTIKVPLNSVNILADHLPTVHTSGQNSPKHTASTAAASVLQENEDQLLAAISKLPSTATHLSTNKEPSINDIILNTTITPNQYHDDAETNIVAGLEEEDLLLVPEVGEFREPRPIGASRRTDLSFSGSDCDMSWVCLFVFILALCFAIPLIYVIYIAEHHIDPEAAGNHTH